MQALTLYFRYALRSFIRGRSRSLFGAFCVGVGVTSVVALGLVGGNFQDSITGNAQKLNRGDVSVVPPQSGFTRREYQTFAALKSRGLITDYTPRLQEDTRLFNPRDSSASTIGALTAVDPSKFPFYDRITADEPSGKPLAELLARPSSAVVSRDTLATLHLSVGDRITVNTRRGFNRSYTIAGVVPDSAPDPNFGSGLANDFIMVNSVSTRSFFNSLNIGATTVYVKTRNAAQAAKAKRTLEARFGSLSTIKTVADVQKDSKDTAAAFNTFFRIMGLVAVMIGGIGIVNTMLVAARRRTKEIAVLKALGMKGRQVVLVFTIESLLLALAGTVLGVVGGIAASIAVNNITEGLAGYAIPWSLHPGAIIAGVMVGIVATVLFAYLPVLRASRARPVSALREDVETHSSSLHIRATLRSLLTPRGIARFFRSQGLRTALLVVVLAVILGYLAVLYGGVTSGPQTFLVGAVVGIGVLVGAGLITQVFVLIVWLISKLPSMGILELRLALRTMGTQKRRLGSTLLALCIGILAVGSVTILAQNLKAFIGDAVSHQQNMNVVLQSPRSPAVLAGIKKSLDRLPGVTHRDTGILSNSAVLVSADGKNPRTILLDKVRRHRLDKESAGVDVSALSQLEGRDARASVYNLHIKAGRNLNRADSGKGNLVLSSALVKDLGLHVGSRVVFQDGALRVPFTIVGTFDPGADFTIFGSNLADRTYLEQSGLSAPSSSHFSTYYLQVNNSDRAADVAALQRQVGKRVLVLDLTNFLSAFGKIIDKFTLFPLIIAALSLFAGVIIIANTVALAMLERRREIGVMKAVGARRRVILQFLVVENAIVGLLGAGMGVLLAMLGSIIVNSRFLHIGTSFDTLTVIGLLLLGVVLSVAASALTALPASSEKPLTVLRYE